MSNTIFMNMIMVIICESFVVICFYTLYIITKMEKFNFVSAIVTGINIKEKRLLKIYNWLSDPKVDLAFIQERTL